MAIDPALSDSINALILNAGRHGQEVNQTIDRNLSQGLGVVNTTAIQQHSAVSDDPAIIAALQTASGAPKQGHVGA